VGVEADAGESGEVGDGSDTPYKVLEVFEIPESGSHAASKAARDRVEGMADTPLDLTLDAAELTARLVDFPSESGTEKPLADAIESALRALPHLTVDRYGNNVVARTRLGRAERVILAGHIDTVPIAGNVPSRLDD
jgi:succinyl-diaminopimelate desuccinylase